jgi:hypothetical protein
MSETDWFERASAVARDYADSETIGRLLRKLDVRAIGEDELRFGFRLGLLRPADAVSLELARLKAGVPLSSAEEQVALTLSDSLDQVEPLIATQPSDEGGADPRRLWHFLMVAAARARWERLGEPRLELREIEEVWGPSNLPAEVMRTRGLDNFYFGRAAQRRFVERVDRYLSDEEEYLRGK